MRPLLGEQGELKVGIKKSSRAESKIDFRTLSQALPTFPHKQELQSEVISCNLLTPLVSIVLRFWQKWLLTWTRAFEAPL